MNCYLKQAKFSDFAALRNLHIQITLLFEDCKDFVWIRANGYEPITLYTVERERELPIDRLGRVDFFTEDRPVPKGGCGQSLICLLSGPGSHTHI